MAFRYTWSFGQRYGFIRQCELVNLDDAAVDAQVTDGLENVLPSGLDIDFQLRFSNLSDAYKKNELISDAFLGIYYLSSIPTDLAEPSEGLRATVVWQQGLPEGSFAFTLCQVPIIYHASDDNRIVIHRRDQEPIQQSVLCLPEAETAQMFSRSGDVNMIEVFFVPNRDCSMLSIH